jgi:hypothetical protein
MPTPQKTFARSIAHPLSEEQALEHFDKAQKLEEQADKRAAKLKDDTKDESAAIKRMRTEAASIRASAKAREELRSVQCYEELRGSQVFVVRADTGEDVDQRAATEEDQQQTFPGLDDTRPGDVLDPDYTPSATSPKAPTERTGKKKRKGRR